MLKAGAHGALVACIARLPSSLRSLVKVGIRPAHDCCVVKRCLLEIVIDTSVGHLSELYWLPCLRKSKIFLTLGLGSAIGKPLLIRGCLRSES